MIKLNKKGFTLIELLVVIAIIALLSTIAIVSLGNARQKARDTKRIADIKQIQTALELDYNNTGTGYSMAGATTPTTAFELTSTTPIGTAMTSVPLTPTPNDGACTVNNNKYQYLPLKGTAICTSATMPCDGYMLQFCTGLPTGGIEAGPHCATSAGITNAGCTAPFVATL